MKSECLVKTYRLIGAGAGVEEASVAVVAVARSRAGGFRVGSFAITVDIRVAHFVARGRNVPLAGRRDAYRGSKADVPVSSRDGWVAGCRSLSKNRDRGQGRDEKPLESNHVDDG